MDHYIGREGKPCRACISVEDLMQKGRKLSEERTNANKKAKDLPSTNDEGSAESSDSHKACPADKDQLGRSTWTLLHTVSVYYPETPNDDDKKGAESLMNSLGRLYPCDFCAKDLRSDIDTDPPRLNSRNEFAKWMCELHNKVNEKMGKPRFDCSKVFERWRDGWKDGSCDF